MPLTGQQNLLQGLIWARAGAARSPWAVRAMTERVLVLSAAPLSAAAASALPQNLQSMGQANLLQATESMSGPLVAPPQEAWVRIGGGSEIAVGSKGNGGASLGLGANCAEVLEQTLKPDQPEALASTEQVL